MSKILVSTGALIGRPNGRDFTLLKDICPRLECDGLEFMMYDSWMDKTAEIERFFCSLSMPVYVFHLEKQIGEMISHGKLNDALNHMEINCSLANKLGAKKLVLHLWNGIISDKNIDCNIECYKYLEEIANEHSLTLTVENVVCNNKDPFTHFSKILEVYPHIQFTFDTKMADFHKQLDLLYTDYAHLVPHITHLHVNDYLGGYKDWSNLKVLHLGKGDIDFNKFFSFMKKQGYEGYYTTEATSFDMQGNINVNSVNETVSKIKNFIISPIS